MSQYVTGNIIGVLWTVLDGSNAAVTGITTPADVTFTLHRESSGIYVAASETVSWAEIGATGSYSVTFTPANTGRYVLQLTEILPDCPMARVMRWDFDVLSAGSVFTPAFANAFCAESDMERWLQQSITSSTRPSSTEAAGFAEGRAAMLMGLCASLGYEVTPSTVTNGSRLQDLLRESNAIGAAADYTIAQSFGTQPSRTERGPWLNEKWSEFYGTIVDGVRIGGAIEAEIRGNMVSFATDHILSGDTAPAAATYPTDVGMQVTMSDVF